MDNKIAYCYLQSVFRDESGTAKAYELVRSDKYFREISNYLASEKGLRDIRSSLEAQFNYSFKDEYLLCRPLKESAVNNLIMGNLDKVIYQWGESGSTIYDLLSEGIGKRFMVLADRYAVPGSVVDGKGATLFSNIRFSASTMSVYFNILTDNGLENKHLICMEDYRLAMRPFYFAVPEDEALELREYKGQPGLGDITINNLVYTLYYADELLIYDMEVLTPTSLVNKASIEVAKTQNAVNILNDYREGLFRALNGEQKKVEWAGGTGSYESSYGVFYKADIDILSARKRGEIMKIILGWVAEGSFRSPEELYERLLALPLAYEEKISGIALLNVVTHVSSVEDALFLSDKAIQCHKVMNAYANIFLYRVRSKVYFTKIGIVPVLNPVFTGSGEAISTIAKEVFYYDGIN